MDSLGTDFDTLLTRGALGALVMAGLWTVVVVLAVALEARTRGRVRVARHLGCPVAVRAWLLGFFVALFAITAPADASDAGRGSGSGETAVTTALDGLPLPDRVSGGPARPPSSAAPHVVVVRPGDSLWRIARGPLADDATESAVAAEVRRLYAENRRTIGAEPDLIVPGQRLLVRPRPTAQPTTHLEDR